MEEKKSVLQSSAFPRERKAFCHTGLKEAQACFLGPDPVLNSCSALKHCGFGVSQALEVSEVIKDVYNVLFNPSPLFHWGFRNLTAADYTSASQNGERMQIQCSKVRLSLCSSLARALKTQLESLLFTCEFERCRTSCLALCLWLSSVVLAAVGMYHIGWCAAKKILHVLNDESVLTHIRKKIRSVLQEVGGCGFHTISPGVCPLSLLFLP